MARYFNGSAKLIGSGHAAQSYPFSYSGWFRVTSVGAAVQVLVSQSTSTNELARVYAYLGNLYLQCSSGSQAISAASVSAGVWFHMGAVLASTTSRKIYVNGVMSGSATDSASINLTSGTPYTSVGIYKGGTELYPLTGDAAQVAVHSVALSDDEMASLAAGVSPRLIRPTALAGHWPLLGRATDEEDWAGSITLVNTSATVSDNQRIIVPASYVLGAPVAAGGGPTNYPATAAESVTALDACSVLIGFASAAPESGTAADTSSQVASLSATATESGSAADTTSQVAALSAAAAESATAADTVNGTAAGDYAGTVTETGSAADTSSNIAAFAGTVAETGAAADSSSNVAALGGTVSEAGTALDTVNGTATGDFAGTVTESASAADTVSNVASLSATTAEAASAADSLAAARAVSALIAEAMSAVDSVSASAAGDYYGTVDELSAAVDAVSQAMAAYAVVAESATALDTVSAGGQLAGVVAELASALELVAAITGNTALGSLAGSMRKRGMGRPAAMPRINRSNIQR